MYYRQNHLRWKAFCMRKKQKEFRHCFVIWNFLSFAHDKWLFRESYFCITPGKRVLIVLSLQTPHSIGSCAMLVNSTFPQKLFHCLKSSKHLPKLFVFDIWYMSNLLPLILWTSTPIPTISLIALITRITPIQPAKAIIIPILIWKLCFGGPHCRRLCYPITRRYPYVALGIFVAGFAVLTR